MSPDDSQPTIVLVHGAFAESGSWNGVIGCLRNRGYDIVAVANPLRGVSNDAAYTAGVMATIDGPIVAVGHSYGGSVISTAATGNDQVMSLVFVAAFAPEEGESIGELSNKLPGSTLEETLAAVPLPDGSADLYIRRDKYRRQFAADVSAEQAAVSAATQRPLRDIALTEGAGKPAWTSIPSWFVLPTADRNIPFEMHRFMAERAEAQEILEVQGASHSVEVSRADAVANVILNAAEFVY
jgi:pimeloyl-ACP methyl ester carboxylesterase